MNQAKGNMSSPFQKIAVAVAFSPRIEAILSESKRLQQLFSAEMYFIHVGKKNLQEEQYLKHLLHRFGLEQGPNTLIWEEGDPVEKILEVCKQFDIDLLVAGALEKESLVKYFMGSVARMLCRKAICSILMLKEPDIHSKPIRKIVVEGSDNPKTANTIETAIQIAKLCNSEIVSVVQEEDASKLALIRSSEFSDNEMIEHKEKITSDEDIRLENILKCTDCGDVKLVTERLEGKPGFMISKFARENEADLLMLNSPDTKLGFIDRVFPHDIEYALADLPCDLLIIHSKSDEQ